MKIKKNSVWKLVHHSTVHPLYCVFDVGDSKMFLQIRIWQDIQEGSHGGSQGMLRGMCSVMWPDHHGLDVPGFHADEMQAALQHLMCEYCTIL